MDSDRLNSDERRAQALADPQTASTDSGNETDDSLRPNEQELLAIYSMAPIGIAVTDASYRFVRTNKAYQDILGRSETELRSMTFLDITHPDDIDLDTPNNRKILTGELDRTRVVKRYLAKDGRVVWVNVNSAPLFDSRGRIVGSVATVEDITEQRNAERALIRSETELTEAQRITHLGSWTWNLIANTHQRSAELWRIYGYPSNTQYDDTEGFLAFVHPDDREAVRERIERAIEQGVGYELTHRILRPNGDVRIIHTRTHVEFDDAGRPALIRGADQDVTEQHISEDEMRRQRALLASAERIAHLGSWESMPSIGINWWSEEVYEILGIDRDEGPGSIISHAHPDDLPIGLKLRDTLRSGESCLDEFRIVRGDGEIRIVRVGGETDLDSQTVGRRILGFIQDVTEARQAEDALRDSEERHRQVFSLAPDPLIVHADGKILLANDAAADTCGYTKPEEMIGESFLGFVHPEDRDLVEQHSKGTHGKAGGQRMAEIRCQHRGGQTRILEIDAVPFRYMGKPSVLVAARDITQRRIAQEEANKARADLTDAIEHMDDGFALFDAEGRLEYANAQYKNLIPWNQDFIVPGRTFREIVQYGVSLALPSWDSEKIGRAIEKRVRQFEKGGEFVEQFEDGRWILLQDLKTRDGRTVSYRTDITQRKKAEDTSRDLEKRLQNFNRVSTMGELASSLAHELNQPLTAVINFIEASRYKLASDDPGAAQNATELLDKAITQASRAGDIIQGLRRFIQEQQSERSLEDINEVIREIWDLASVGSADHGLQIRFENGENLPPALMDRTQIQQVLVNLMRNGIEAMENVPKRILVVKTGLDAAENLTVSVSDSGSGLTDKARENLFQPFNSEKPEGMGFGLSICHSIIESHGGIIWAESEPGDGTTFFFSLPLNADELRTASEG